MDPNGGGDTILGDPLLPLLAVQQAAAGSSRRRLRLPWAVRAPRKLRGMEIRALRRGYSICLLLFV